MKVTTDTRGDALVVSVDDIRIDPASAIGFKDSMFNATRGAQGRIILDLSRAEFVNSSGLGAIVASMKALGAGARMDFVGLSPMVDKVFRPTHMDKVFRIFPDMKTACNKRTA